MTFVGGALTLTPLAAGIALAVGALLSRIRSFAVGARVGVAGVPVLQFAIDGPGRAAATGGLMALIGALFLADRLRRRVRGTGDPSSCGPGAPR